MRPPPTHDLVNKLILLTLGLLVFAGTLGLGAVYVRQEIFAAANRSHVTEQRLAEVNRRLNEVNAAVAAALNPEALLAQNERMHLGLTVPRELQVVRIDESPELRLVAKHNREIFSNGREGDAAGVSFRIVQASYTR